MEREIHRGILIDVLMRAVRNKDLSSEEAKEVYDQVQTVERGGDQTTTGLSGESGEGEDDTL